jgi:hypothetical protein
LPSSRRRTLSYTKPTTRKVNGDCFGATNTGTAAGFIGTVMQSALNSGHTNTGFIHTMDRLFMYNAAGSLGSGGYENAYCKCSYWVTPELGSGPAPAEFMNGMLNKAKAKVDDCVLITGGWTATSYAQFDSGETYLKDLVVSPLSL